MQTIVLPIGSATTPSAWRTLADGKKTIITAIGTGSIRIEQRVGEQGILLGYVSTGSRPAVEMTGEIEYRLVRATGNAVGAAVTGG